MTQTGIQEKVVEIVAQQMEKEPATLGISSSFEQLGADELDCIEIVMRLEEEFGIEISDADADRIVSVAAAVAYLKDRIPAEK